MHGIKIMITKMIVILNVTSDYDNTAITTIITTTILYYYYNITAATTTTSA